MSYRPSTTSRSWGTRFDTLLASPPTSPPVCGTILDSASADVTTLKSAFGRPKEEKAPHDASIFVGSLPCNVDQAELSRLLSDHLAEYQEIVSVKVVRDSKGGICAFVQCDDASSAASLINTLRSGTPRPFIGRILRYEPARAFRTLLVSYKTPVQVLVPNGISGTKQTAILDLPYAMRLWKPKDSKYFNVVYNAEAVDLEERYGGTPVSDQYSDQRFFMQPMVFDGEAIRSIASFFGVLECFERLKPNKTAEQHATCLGRRNCPFPHNSPRNACMEDGCWEIKWKHRDDCVSALMALRRIPHLTVTWAHQLSQNSADCLATRQEKEAKAAVTAIWPLIHNREPALCSRDPSDSPTSFVADNPENTTSFQSGITDGAEMGFTRSIDQKTCIDYELQEDVDDLGKPERAKLNWSDEDFEPVVNSQEPSAARWAAWKEQKIDQSIVQNRVMRAGSDQLDIASTPGLGMSPITPKSFGSGFPSTPTDLSGELSGLSLDPKLNSNDLYDNKNVFKGKPIDPTTLFVGGLEMFGPNAWDESKVRRCFEKYGTLENVKFVRPYNSCSAFAFVKFKSVDGPARAIQEEHNRIYGGKAIRVQLRECNVPRGTWKPLRTRGRYTGSPSYPNRRSEKNIGTGVHGAQCQSQAGTVSSTESEEHRNGFGLQAPKSYNHDVRSSAEVVLGEINSKTINPAIGPGSSCLIEPMTSQENGNAPQIQETASGSTTTPQTSSVSFSMYPFAYPGCGYYPAPWFHPYLQQIQYQFPYYTGYPGYMVPPPIPRPPHSNADTNCSTGAHSPWQPQTHPYGSYISYPTSQLSRIQPMDTGTTTSYGQMPIVPSGLVQTDQAPLVGAYPNEQYSSEAQATSPASHMQSNIPIWPHFPGQQCHYSTPGPLNANAKAFIPPPGVGWVPTQSGVSQGMSTSLSPVTNSHRQPAEGQRGNIASRRFPQNRPFVGRNVRGTTNFGLSKDDRQVERPKSMPEPADWI